MTTIIHTTGLSGIDVSVATFRGMSVEDAMRDYDAYYGHPCASVFVVDDCALNQIIYLEISEVDIENYGVLVARRNRVVNR